MTRSPHLFWFLLWLLVPCRAPAAFRVFLLIPDIPGSSIDENHRGWVELSGFGSLQQPGTVSGVVDFSMAKDVDRTTPLLNLACASRRSFAEMRIEIEIPDRRAYQIVRMVLKQAVITSITTRFDPNAEQHPLTDTITLSCRSLSWSNGGGYVTFLPILQRGSPLPTDRHPGRAVVRASGTLRADHSVEIRWKGKAGRTYQVFGSRTLEGPLVPIAVVKASAGGSQRLSRTVLPGLRFFLVEESMDSP